MMNRTSHPLFTLGKVAYYIGLLLLFNFFFGLIFFRFFVWLIAGGVLLAGLWFVISLGKNMLFGQGSSENTADENPRQARRTKARYSDAIDVEAEVFDDNKEGHNT